MTAKAAGAVAPMAVAALALLTPAPATVPLPPQPPLQATALPADAPEVPPAVPNAAPPACLASYQLALPVQRGAGVARRETLICRRGYILAFNNDTRNPDWVMEHLTPAELSGNAHRSNHFVHDPALPLGTDATSADYSAGHFDRGHQAPAGDASFDQHVQDESFYFTNMSPQVGLGFNRGAWRMLEEQVRDAILCGGHQDVYVITGPIYGPNPGVTGADRVAVPQAYFKIVYDTLSGYGVGFVMPNRAITTPFNAQDYVQAIAGIETATGLDFFSAFDRRRQALLESEAGNAWGHTGACAAT